MGNTVLEWHVKYCHRVGNQKNPECEKLYRMLVRILFLQQLNCKEKERGRSYSLK